MMNELLPRPWKTVEYQGRCDHPKLLEFLREKDRMVSMMEGDMQGETVSFFGEKDDQDITGKTESALGEVSSDIQDERIRGQAYALTINSDGVAVASGGKAGFLYALSTLLKLFESDGSLPCVTILDKPALPYRGFLQDLSRGQVLSVPGLKRLVDVLSALKYNFLTFNIEHTFSFRSHPEIGAGHDPLFTEELAGLNALGKIKGIEIIPSQQSLGHMRGILSLPEYRHLAYDEKLCWSIDPSKEESYKLLRDMYEEIIPCYDSEFFNVCCDEPFDLKRNFDESRFGGRPFARVYFDHLMRLKDILDDHKKRMMVWGDMLLSHPEILEWLPKDVTVLNWKYGSGLREGPEYYREKIQPVADAGLEFMTCTCTWSLTKVFTNLDMAEANNLNFIREGIKAGSKGNILTNWGDLGHMNLLGLQAWPIAYAGQIMWSGEPMEPDKFDKAFSSSFFQDDTGEAAALMRKLQDANNILGHPVFGDTAFQVFFDETLAGDFMLICRGKDGMAEELEKTVDEAQAILDELLSSRIIRKEWLEDLSLPLRQLGIIAEKARIFNQGKEKIKSPEGMDEISRAFRKLAAMTMEAAKTLERRWLAQAKRSDLELNLERFSRLIEVYAKRSEQFKDLAARLKNGGPSPKWHEITHDPGFIPHKFDIIKEIGLKDLL